MSTAPNERVLPAEARERIRESWMAERKRYSPLMHLGLPAVFGSVIVVVAASLIRDLRWWEVAFGAALFVLANATEWRIHQSLLHRRFRPAATLYERHTPRHHMVFVTDDMAIRSPQEFRLVLLPGYAIVALVLFLSPITAAIWVWGAHNLAAVFALVTTGTVLVYEWLHLSYHLPPDSAIGSLPAIRWLSRHHSVHHDPRIMQRWNMNVTLPLWDFVRRTWVRSADEALRIEREHQAAASTWRWAAQSSSSRWSDGGRPRPQQ